VEAARLYYNDLNKPLVKKMGFERNRYDPWVHNKKTIVGTVTARNHFDDIKISSRSEEQLLIVINEKTLQGV
jgi:hypothetical protein